MYNADSITTLDGIAHVRKRPEMYIGSVGPRGLVHLIYEVIDNSVDEHLTGYCNNIWLTLNSDGSCTIEDDGRGIPVDLHKSGLPAVRVVLTNLNTGGKFDDKSYKSVGGLHGIGVSAVNALSTWMTVDVYRDGHIWHDKYEYGKPVVELENGLLPITGDTTKVGTKISFLPDDTIFENTKFKGESIKARLHETAYLNPNLTLHFQDLRGETPEEITYHEPEGIKKYVESLNSGQETIHPPVQFTGEFEDEGKNIVVDCAFQYTNTFQEQEYGFCNNISNPEGGTHITGFKTALTTLLNQYARQIGVLKDKDSNFLGTDIRTGLTAIVAVKHPDPRFEGQTKTKLDNQDASRAVAAVTTEKLTWYFDRHLDELRNILSMAEKAVKIRKQETKSKENILSSKKKFTFDSNGKLANCESRDASKCEIFIVEGDSAGGSAKSGRNRKYQSILPIRGKILNVEKANMSKVLANEEIKSMINAFGCGFGEGYGNDFNIEKLKYDKIIIMADSDIDGYHISTLLMTLFYRFFPELVYNGHIYLACSPLYIATYKNGQKDYLLNDEELEKYKQSHTGYTLGRAKGLGELNPDELWETTMNPETRKLLKVTVEEAEKASTLTSILMGNDVEPRKKYIVDHAEGVELDI